MIDGTLNARWLGQVGYKEMWDLQRGFYHFNSSSYGAVNSAQNHLLLLEHSPVYTFGRHGDRSHLLVEPADVGAEEFWVDRGGDVTFHGPGQLVGYPILTLNGAALTGRASSGQTEASANGRIKEKSEEAGGGAGGEENSTRGRQRSGLLYNTRYVRELEELLLEVLGELGVRGAHRRARFPGIWIDNVSQQNGAKKSGAKESGARKIASIGVRLNRGRTLHGFGLNVSTDLSWFDDIVPCGISGIEMTSIQNELSKNQNELNQKKSERNKSAEAGVGADTSAEKAAKGAAEEVGGEVMEGVVKAAEREVGGEAEREVKGEVAGVDVSVEKVAELVARTAAKRWGAKLSWAKSASPQRLKISNPRVKAGQADIEAPPQSSASRKTTARKPEWLRVPIKYTENYSRLKLTLKDLPTVCESAGCPNLSECWGAGTATFMINGDRCTRNCGFCLVDTQKPLAPDETEPARLAEAVKSMGLDYVVITAVARDDLPDGGAAGFVESIRAVRQKCPNIQVEVLIPDFKGRMEPLEMVFAEEPEVLNHNIETVLRLQRKVRPQAGYARSLAVLARAKAAGLTTKSSIMVGLGETMDEVKETLADLAGIGTDIVTIGQYLQPSAAHLPVERWWLPEEFEELAALARDGILNIAHIEAGPLVRSSYKAGSSYNSSRGSSPHPAEKSNRQESGFRQLDLAN